MAKKCKITFLDEVHAKITGLDPATANKCVDKMKFLVPYRFHVPSYRLGRWDGSIRFFDKNGRTFINLLNDLVPIIASYGYEFDFADERQTPDITVAHIDNDIFADTLWPEGHFMEGQPIRLRDDQVYAANMFADNRYGLQILATGFGKCLGYETPMSVRLGDDGEDIFPHGTTILEIGEIYKKIVEKLQASDAYDKAISISEDIISVDSPNGFVPINGLIRKRSKGFQFTLENGYRIRVADRHIFYAERKPVLAKDIFKYGFVDTKGGRLRIVATTVINEEVDFYDISVAYPHTYYDANGLKHHNTLLTAAVCKVAEPFGRTITIVPSKSLVEQTAEDFRMVGMDTGVYYGDCKELGKTHTISTWQSLQQVIKDAKKKPELIQSFKEDLVQVIVDECHQAKADALNEILAKTFNHVPLRRGFTGTLPKEEYDAKTIIANIGNVVNKVSAKELQDRGILAKCHVRGIMTKDAKAFSSYDEESRYLTKDLTRLKFISDFVNEIRKSGNTLVLVGKINTGEFLNDEIAGSRFVYGNTKVKERTSVYKSVQKADNEVIIATFQVAAVGINIPRIFNLVMIEPGKSFVRVIQTIGRGVRVAKDKDFVQIYDIFSQAKFSKKHYGTRVDYYDEAEYPHDQTSGTYNEILEYIRSASNEEE